MKIVVTGGAGFIGSTVIKLALKQNYKILNIDSLSYAGNTNNLKCLSNNENYKFKKINILNFKKILEAIEDFKPNYLMHLAACSHVDNSISSPLEFIKVNIEGTFNLLEVSRSLLKKSKLPKNFRFHYVSTDEVYGSLKKNDFFDEDSNINPRNPYSASKASAEHLVKSWGNTYNLPFLISNCSNNYGPFQHPEKLIPKVIINALLNKKIPIYGNGKNIRDWLHVYDHAYCLLQLVKKGKLYESYNIGCNNEITNIALVKKICRILDKKNKNKNSHLDLITFINDRAGHDQRYAINPKKINNLLDWQPDINFQEGLNNTIDWYIDNRHWWKNLI